MTSQEDERWPNEVQRAERKATLLAKLDTYLSTQVPSDSGWPDCSWDDVRELRDIFREVADLRFARDCDGDSVIDLAVVSHKQGRLISYFEPYSPDIHPEARGRDPNVSEDDHLAYASEITRLGQSLVSQGESLVGRGQREIDGIIRAREQLRIYRAKINELDKLIDTTPFEPMKELLDAFRRQYSSGDQTDFWEMQQHFYTKHAEVYVPFIERANAGLDLNDDSNLGSVKSLIEEAGGRLGWGPFEEVINRHRARIKAMKARKIAEAS